MHVLCMWLCRRVLSDAGFQLSDDGEFVIYINDCVDDNDDDDKDDAYSAETGPDTADCTDSRASQDDDWWWRCHCRNHAIGLQKHLILVVLFCWHLQKAFKN